MEVQTAALECFAQLACAVVGQDRDRQSASMHRSNFRNTHLIVAQKLQQERLEFLIGAVDLVDQQYCWLLGTDRLENRALDQKVLGEEDIFMLP